MQDKTPLEFLETIHGKVCVVGSMNVDYTITTEHFPGPGETLAGGELNVCPGGKSANQAACAAKLGADVCLLGAVGQDSGADFLIRKLKSAGVDTSQIQTQDGSTGACIIMVDGAGENSIVYSAGANAKLDCEYVRDHADAIEGASVLGLCFESPMPTVIEAARIAHNAGVSVLVNNSPFIEELPEDLVKLTDILLVNEHEMAQLTGLALDEEASWETLDWNQIQDAMKAIGFDRVVVTLGSKGSVVIDKDTIHFVEPHKVECVDTTGCGDSFMGCILAGLATGYSLSDSADMASYVAAYAACGQGAQSSYGCCKEIKEAFSE